MFDNGKKRFSYSIIGLCSILLILSWKPSTTEESWQWIQRCLLQSFNHYANSDLKKWDLSVTPDGFFRLRKYFPSGKQEYFSFHFKRLRKIEYSGSPDSGSIVFKTMSDDVIVQTYNDPKGNIDSMSTLLEFPVLKMETPRLDSLQNALFEFKY